MSRNFAAEFRPDLRREEVRRDDRALVRPEKRLWLTVPRDAPDSSAALDTRVAPARIAVALRQALPAHKCKTAVESSHASPRASRDLER